MINGAKDIAVDSGLSTPLQNLGAFALTSPDIEWHLTPGIAFGKNGERFVRVSICINIDEIESYFV